MPTYLRPGVYVEELESEDPLYRSRSALVHPAGQVVEPVRAGRPRWVAEHSIAAFVGLAASGPAHLPVLIQSWQEFEQRFGGVVDGCYLGHAVRGFFSNGGEHCYVLRVNDSEVIDTGPDDVVGEASDRTGLSGLEAIKDISFVCIPDVMTLHQRGILDMEAVKAVQISLIAHCEFMGDRIAILDCPGGMSPQQIKQWRLEVTGYDSKYAALYYPWIRVAGPDYRTVLVPPSGHVAGVHARADLHRAAANEPIRGAVGLETDLLLGEQDQLSPVGVNALVGLPGRGLLVWGARTLSSDPEWRFLRKRRLANFINRNIVNGTDWVIFKNAWDRSIRQGIARDLGDLLATLWRSGLLRGDEPEDAYYVKCDEENNPAEVVDSNTIMAECAAAMADGSQLNFRVVYFMG